MPSVRESATVAGATAMYAIAATLLCLLALNHYRSEQKLRLQALAFADRFSFEVRRPEMVRAIRLAPSGNHALALATDTAVRDATESVRIGSLDSIARVAWLTNARSQTEELNAATAMALDAAATRPGSATRWATLGEVTFLLQRRVPSPAVALWIEPLALATRSAPSRDATFQSLGGASLERWNDLSLPERVVAKGALKRAFYDADFTARAFAMAAARIGMDRALQLVPERAGPLRAVYASVAQSGDVPHASAVARRFESAERSERDGELRDIRERVRRFDHDGARRAIVRWASRHPVRDSAGPEGLRQAATLLELWPPGDEGSWKTDPRAEIVRFLLELGAGESTPAIGSITAAIPDAPHDMVARAHVRAGDMDTAESIERNAQTAGLPEWTPYFVELARAHILAHRVDDARKTLERIPFEARERCDVLLVRREVAGALGDVAERTLVNDAIGSVVTSSIQDWTSISPLPICIDPDRLGSTVVIDIRTSTPTLINYGWVGGQLGRVKVDDYGSIIIPLGALKGSRSLFLSPITEAGTVEWRIRTPFRLSQF